MIVKVFALSITTILVGVVLIWSLFALFRLIRRELDIDYSETRAATRDMREATEDLEDSIRRAERREAHKGEAPQQGDLK